MRKDLIRWQWDGYPTFHQQRSTLWIHIVAVPAFVSCGLGVAIQAVLLRPVGAGLCALGMAVAFAAQGIAHKREENAPIPFDGAGDAVSRILLEQCFTFPRFVLSGGWWRALRR